MISKGAAIAWPPQSPDLTPPDVFLWGYIKDVLFKDSTGNLRELKETVRAAIIGISQEACAKVEEEAKRDLILCAARDGSHVEKQ